ncbi:MAG TPA: hypothetical protein PKU78_01300 [Candidatus Dojkabacteria bacterium]|nr:hypothetical protein [Candidatus Dojkabacteria bacterium]HRO64838.1 hypothetical protein [Candidatus Dojkabacteria bacterium]HRP51587.1 hypothetical protein [Candidatus Dojkabacteria bacterium]
MDLFNYPKTLGLLIFVVVFTYLSWKTFIGKFKHEKLFDFTFLYLFFGFLTERTLFIVTNWIDVNNLQWSFVSFVNTLPISLLNFDLFSGFSLIYFFIGAIFGISLYNFINTIQKVEYNTLDRITRLAILCLLPSVLLGMIFTFIDTGRSGAEFDISLYIPNLVRLFEFVLLLAIFNFFNNFWLAKSGLYTSISVLFITIGEIILDYLDPSYVPNFFGIINYHQIIGVLSIILSINLLLTSIATLQEQEIRKKLKPLKPSMNKGFAISFANRRRVSNPINIKIKNLTSNKRKYRDSINRP